MRLLPKDFDGVVRLFPLNNFVFFPHNVVPLHIFESRYREMMEDALQTDKLLTMATLLPGFEDQYYSRPPVAPQVCIGRVSWHRKNPNGTYDLLLQGLGEAMIESEIEPLLAYRRAKVHPFAEWLENETHRLKPRCHELCNRIATIHARLAELAKQFKEGELTPECLIDVVAFHVDIPVEVKLEMLAMRDYTDRLSRLLNALPKSEPRLDENPFAKNFGLN